MPSEPFHRLFFAVRPPVDAVSEIAALRDAFGQTKGLVTDAHLHLTTWLLPDSRNFPVEEAIRAQRAMDEMPLTSFRIVLDRMVAGPGHVVLVPSEKLPGYTTFQAALDRVLRGCGLLPRPDWHFSPHLTLLHGRQDAIAKFDPIAWRATEIVLIDSIVGQRRHDVIARWPLA